MNILEKAELTTSVRHIERFSKSGIPIYNSEIPDTAVRKPRRRRRIRIQVIAKCYSFYVNTTTLQYKKDFKKTSLSFISNFYYDCIFK